MGEVNEGIKPDTTTDNYDTWTWKQIKVAVCGGFGMSANKELDMRDGVSNPTTMMDASFYFGNTQTTLVGVQTGLEALQKSVEATWKGKGADAFTKMLDRFKGAVDAMVEAMAGVGAEPSYSRIMTDSATDLTNAINDIQAADYDG